MSRTTADSSGNIRFNLEVCSVDALEIGMAAKASGGIVIAQVEPLIQRDAFGCNQIYIPVELIDAIVVHSGKNNFLSKFTIRPSTGKHMVSCSVNLLKKQQQSKTDYS